MKKFLKKIITESSLKQFFRKIFRKPEVITFDGVANYWEQRYKTNGNSGAGSYGRLAAFKAKVINEFVNAKKINSVIEFGCGDGNQLTLAKYPKYIGLDVSQKAIDVCSKQFSKDNTKKFYVLGKVDHLTAELTLSLDVIFHLVEDVVYEGHMQDLFTTSSHYVVIYSSNYNDDFAMGAAHVKHRKFINWVNQNVVEFELIDTIKNIYPYVDSNPDHTSFADFYFFERKKL
jgi:protein O-GlcNAc transferase